MKKQKKCCRPNYFYYIARCFI